MKINHIMCISKILTDLCAIKQKIRNNKGQCTTGPTATTVQSSKQLK